MQPSFRKEANGDLREIYRFGVERFGWTAVDRYYDDLIDTIDLLVVNPRMGRERSDLLPGIRMHAHRSHVIFYRLGEGGQVIVARILHARQDWARHLKD